MLITGCLPEPLRPRQSWSECKRGPHPHPPPSGRAGERKRLVGHSVSWREGVRGLLVRARNRMRNREIGTCSRLCTCSHLGKVGCLSLLQGFCPCRWIQRSVCLYAGLGLDTGEIPHLPQGPLHLLCLGSGREGLFCQAWNALGRLPSPSRKTPLPSPLSPSFLSGCFEGEKCSRELGHSPAVTVMWGEDRRGISGSDPPGPPGKWWLLTSLTPEPRFPTLTPVLQILLQPVPQHL